MRRTLRSGKKELLALYVAGCVGAAAPHAWAFESVRAQEIAECRSGEIVTWGDGQDRRAVANPLRFTYDPAGAPAWFAPMTVAAMVARAAAAWSQCGIPSELMAWTGAGRQDLIRVQWHEKDSGGNFGLANLGRRTLSLGPQAFEMLRARNPQHDANDTLQMVISHEMGHFFGLMAHSRRCVDVLSYYHNNAGEQCLSRAPMQASGVAEYRHNLPTACDLERCRIANGMPVQAGRQAR